MNITYHSKFKKDIRKINDRKLKESLLDKIQEMKKASSVEDLSGVKKMSGHSTAYRMRIGGYRLGFYLENEGDLQLKRFIKRNDIYKLFP